MNSRKRKVYLHTPEFEELGYRQSLLADPETMSYNSGYDLDYEGYDNQTGCIAFPQNEWAEWYEYFIGHKDRYYAYVMRYEDESPVGEVNLHMSPDEKDTYDMGVVIQAEYRHQGYGKEALELLLHHAFVSMNAEKVRNTFENDRDDAWRIHKACGFDEIGFTLFAEQDDIHKLEITRHMYMKQRNILAISDGLVIRKMREDDLDCLISLLGDEETMKYLEPVYDRKKTEEFLHQAGLCEPPKIYAADDENGNMTGYVIYHPYDSSSMETGWVLKKEARRKGIATKLTDILWRLASDIDKDSVIECVKENEIAKHIANEAKFALIEEKDGLLVFRKKQLEYWNAYDRDLNLIDGLYLTRGEPIPDDVYHLVCDIIVRHKDGTYLLMRRAANKKFGGMWEATAGGSAFIGETPVACAKRELQEETGIKADRLQEVGRMVNEKYHTIFVEFLCETDWPKDQVKIQEFETDAYQWVSRKELLAMTEGELVTKRMQGFIDDLKKEKD